MSVSTETLVIQHDRLLAAVAEYVTPDDQAGFLNAVVFGINVAQRSEKPTLATATKIDDTIASYPLSPDQARELRGRLDDKSVEMIRTMVTPATDDVATINWPEVKKITGVRDWSSFARGRLGGIHRSLRNLPGIPKDAILIWEGEGWLEDGKGDYSAGLIGIDGPAIRSLRIALNIRD